MDRAGFDGEVGEMFVMVGVVGVVTSLVVFILV